MRERAPLSVVVPTRDRAGHLTRCLDALNGVVGPSDEVIVVDSASLGTRTMETARGAGARLVVATIPGASLARNLGWGVARHDIVAFVDDDVTVSGGWAEAIVAPFADPAVGFVTGRVELPADEHAERAVVVSFGEGPRRIGPATGGAWGGSGNAAVRRRALEAIGGFDERLGPGTWTASAEDLDLFDRLLGAGWAGSYEPAALGHHHQHRDRSQLVRLDWGYGKGMGARLVRLWRRDPSRARRVAREVVWDGGIRTIAHDLAAGYEFGAFTVGIRMFGTLVGAAVTVASSARR